MSGTTKWCTSLVLNSPPGVYFEGHRSKTIPSLYIGQFHITFWVTTRISNLHYSLKDNVPFYKTLNCNSVQMYGFFEQRGVIMESITSHSLSEQSHSIIHINMPLWYCSPFRGVSTLGRKWSAFTCNRNSFKIIINNSILRRKSIAASECSWGSDSSPIISIINNSHYWHIDFHSQPACKVSLVGRMELMWKMNKWAPSVASHSHISDINYKIECLLESKI